MSHQHTYFACLQALWREQVHPYVVGQYYASVHEDWHFDDREIDLEIVTLLGDIANVQLLRLNGFLPDLSTFDKEKETWQQ